MALVLAIDDHQPALEMITLQLKKLEHITITATSGEDGLELARTGNPDVILLDITMPVMDGFDVLDALASNPVTKNIPVIMLTSSTQKENVIKSMKYGVKDYLSKKFDIKVFKNKIDAAIEHKRSHMMQLEKSVEKNIVISSQMGKTIISFRGRLNMKGLIDEAKKLFNSSFHSKTKNTLCVIDFRYLIDLEKDEIGKIHEIIGLFPEREINIVAGKHYGTISLETDFEERINLFISYGDMELFSYSGAEELPDVL